MKALSILIVFLSISIFGKAQTRQAPEVPSPIIFIYDASGSMWGQLEGKTKMEVASTVLSQSINNFAENQQIGLIAYGHRNKGDCRDVETLLPMSNTSKSEVTSAINKIKPLGKTPLAFSATTVIDQLRTSKKKATIVLITDGIESCDGNICDVVAAAKKEGIDFKLHIVGFGLKEGETAQLECATKAGGGEYFDAADAEGLSAALEEVAGQTIDKPEGNLGVFVTKNGKPLDAQVRAYLSGSKNRTDQGRTYQDTVFLFLPQAKYDLEVFQHSFGAVSAVTIKDVETFNDKTVYKTVSLDGGKLKVVTTNNGKPWDSNISVKTPEAKNVIGGRTYGKEKLLEVDAGTYNITLKARDIFGVQAEHTMKNIMVNNATVTNAEHDFKTGEAIIGGTFGGNPFDVGVRITDADTGENVYNRRTYKKDLSILLNPGTYNVVLVEHGVYNATAKSASFTMEIKQGETITLIKEVK